MLKYNITKNKTPLKKETLDWLVKFCFDYVNKVNPLLFDYTYRVECGQTRKSFKGRHYSRGLIRVWIEFSLEKGCDMTYTKWKDMPVFHTENVIETFVYVMAHEIGHHKWTGRKGGEFKCELLAQDCVIAFRKVYDKFLKFKDRVDKRKPKVTKVDKERAKFKKQYDAKIRWVRNFCKENNISYNLIRNTWDDEMSFTVQGEGRIFEGLGDYMYCVGVTDAMERLQANPIVLEEETVA